MLQFLLTHFKAQPQTIFLIWFLLAGILKFFSSVHMEAIGQNEQKFILKQLSDSIWISQFNLAKCISGASEQVFKVLVCFL